MSDEARSLDARVQLRVSREELVLSAPRQPPSLRFVSHVIMVALLVGGPALGFWALHPRVLGYLAVCSPFLLVGLLLLRRNVLPFFQTTTIKLAPDGGTISTTPFGATRRLRLADLRVRLGHHPDFPNEEGNLDSAVLLDHGREKFSFLIAYREEAQRRVVEVMREWLRGAAAS